MQSICSRSIFISLVNGRFHVIQYEKAKPKDKTNCYVSNFLWKSTKYLVVRSIKSNWVRTSNKFKTKWNLLHVFIMILRVKYKKVALYGHREFFYLNKLWTRFFSWNISVTEVNIGRKLHFCFYLSQITS